MPLVRRTLVVPLVLVLVVATPPLVGARSTGNSDANILFGSSRRGEGPGTSSQAGGSGSVWVTVRQIHGSHTGADRYRLAYLCMYLYMYMQMHIHMLDRSSFY